jgi:hypothetical protein
MKRKPMKGENMYRQGDVFVIKCGNLPENIKQIRPKNGKAILAEGEATGHHHAVSASHAKLYAAGALMYLAVARACYLRHQEHGEIRLPVGNYRVVRQREYSPEEIRHVAD